jgi:cyclic pyranopterin phosphate synthase
MTDKFCGGCNRLRINADGSLRNCLFGRDGVSLRDAIRAGSDDTELERLVAETVRAKKAAHAGMLTIAEQPDRPMILIGG